MRETRDEATFKLSICRAGEKVNMSSQTWGIIFSPFFYSNSLSFNLKSKEIVAAFFFSQTHHLWGPPSQAPGFYDTAKLREG